ncbi:Rrf2 family transcriptional regulator [Vibrio sp. Vb2880]|nr:MULTISPECIES: Rrf2 family transcriptional regulator [Vibrio]MBO0213654.1 Rrf2 family transcriptional regulator [Vibrio sp. Vb2880]MCG6228922.1 Rrf2 family transcriptional regulator [Vibrio furnissii]MCG6234575.1 Rrf2 family transcriptional regulator [Vibrio furnissii]MCG6257834.1 Rrf2 family transcriptional regulator [Vibrio furnissii]MCG6267368.1 Rrf2 family transcriptional regulator [Vibrio furnissii]
MRLDSRLSRVLHILLHLVKQPMTSEQFATMLGTNAVVIRRTMAGLRDAGYVTSTKGQGGGWTLSCDLQRVTLLDIYQAVGEPKIFSIGFDNVNPNCVVEKAVNASLRDVLHEAEVLLLTRFSQISLADLSQEFIAQLE